MLWTEPWLQLASSSEGTRIPPPRPCLPDGVVFRLRPALEGICADWLTFVGTALSVEAAMSRVGSGTLIAELVRQDDRERVATCVLRPLASATWNLETFVARPRGARWGEWLLRAVMWELWFPHGATLVFQWELAGLPQLLGAWWRGWLASARAIEYGWRWRRAAERETCGFCPVTEAWLPPDGKAVGGIYTTTDGLVSVADSGLCDGWGYVLTRFDDVKELDWSAIAAMGGWRELWYRGPKAPGPDWQWTGEWVVIGCVGIAQPNIQALAPYAAEIPFS
jgi:hypothetical protein